MSEGLNILDVKSKTTSNRKIIRQKDKIVAQISKKWDKVSKIPHFYKFRANQEKKLLSTCRLKNNVYLYNTDYLFNR